MAEEVEGRNAVVAVPHVHEDLPKLTLWPPAPALLCLLFIHSFASPREPMESKSCRGRNYLVGAACDRLVIVLVVAA